MSSAQLSHVSAFPSENLPAVHSRHPLDTSPVEYVPASHSAHSLATSDEYHPAPHARHVVAWKIPENVPAPHAVHELLASSALYRPGAHEPHTQGCHKHISQSQSLPVHSKSMLPSPYHLVGPAYPGVRAYHSIIARAQAAFQRRLNRIEVELAEAQHTLDCIELANPDRKLALAMASHPSLGQDSHLLALPEDLLQAIAMQAAAV